MADTKIYSNGNLDIWLVPINGLADWKAPTADELNAALRVSPAVAWDSTTFPSATESNDVDDRSIEDRGDAKTRGFEQFEATLNIFRPKNVLDVSTDYGKAFQALKTPRTNYYLVTRVLQRETGIPTPAKPGDLVSVYKMISDALTDDTEGEDSYKLTVSFLQQGDIKVYTMVKISTPVVLEAEATSVAVGESISLLASMNNTPANRLVDWSTSDPAIASVSQNGVVTGVAAGSATITAAHPSASAAGTQTITVS